MPTIQPRNCHRHHNVGLQSCFPPLYYDVVWASPDCVHYSIARTTAKTPRDFEKADRLVQACRDIIEYFCPKIWFIENPDTGYLKTRPCVQGLPHVRVDYCMYSNCPYRKRTRLWTNCTDWIPTMCDWSHCINGRHIATAQRAAEETRTTRRSHGMNCIVYHRHCVRRSTQSASRIAQFQRL